MAEKIKTRFKIIYGLLYGYFLKVILKIFRVFFLDNSLDYKLYGTGYGGMIIADHKSLDSSIVLSAGTGEDLTFDIELINKHIEFVLKKNKRIITIHITGPFVLHKLLNIKYNFNNITELKINKKYDFGDSHFIYINDIVPETAIAYFEYLKA